MRRMSRQLSFAFGLITGSVLTYFLFVRINNIESCQQAHGGHELSEGVIIEQLVPTFSEPELYSVHHAPPDSVSEMTKFMRPPKKKRGVQADSKRTHQPGQDQKVLREQVLVGMLTQEEYLPTRAKAVYETWGKEVDKLVFFVGEDCVIPSSLSHLPVVKLPGIPDHVYPPLLKAFAVVQYMYTHYINQYQWFVRADDDMYLRPDKLMKVLRELDPSEHAYLGLSGRGRKEDLGRLRLLSGERYCLGGPGVFLSRATLAGLGPHLDNCLSVVLYHNRMSNEGNQWNDDDVEIGRCLSRKVGVQCSHSAQTSIRFHFDFPGLSHYPTTLWTSPLLREVITLHAIKDPANMYAVHHFYNTLLYEQRNKELQELADQIQSVCDGLPSYMSPPLLKASCDLGNTHHTVNRHGNDQGVHVEKIPSLHRPLNRLDVLPWKQFNATHVHDSGSMLRVYPLPPTLRAELATTLTTLGESGDIVNGYVRYNPMLGREYMVTLSAPSGESSSYRMFRPLSPALSMLRLVTSQGTIYTLLPLAKITLELNKFVLNYAKFASDDNHLVVVVPSSVAEQAVSDLIGRLTRKPLHVTVVVSSDEFNHVMYVDVGVASIQGDGALLFIANIGVRFGHGFFTRCHDNSLLSERAYFPIPLMSVDVKSWVGAWHHGLVCLHAGDYKRAGGYRGAKSVTALWERLVGDGVEVVEAPDPGLGHEWVEKGYAGGEVYETLSELVGKEQLDSVKGVSEQEPLEGREGVWT